MKEKSSPVVESAVCGVLTELAAVSVRLHKQPGGGEIDLVILFLVVRVLVEIDLVKLFLGVRVLVEIQGIFLLFLPIFSTKKKNDG